MIIKIATFNLFQFCSPEFSFYTKKEKFTKEDWEEKKIWIKGQLLKIDCDIVGFQEVFSQEELKELVFECGFKEFVVSNKPKLDEKNNVYKTTTVALASKFPIKEIKKVSKSDNFTFAREPIKATLSLKNDLEINVYVAHLKSNRLNEFEYKFTKDSTLEEKKLKLDIALKNNYSLSLKQRLNEVKALHFDIKKDKLPSILLCDLNDREFSITIDALTNKRFYIKELKKDDFILFDSYDIAPKKVYNPHPEFKGFKRIPTSYFVGHGNTLDFIFVSKDLENSIKNHKVFDEHLQKNKNGTLKQSDHAQVVCEIEI
ncbi:endonuclease [Aliarcobacter cryaerophilus ATCC 43158]|uniref:Endonuclease/exonuclease/phosphatase n=1 Tax=Aliarcobacter cryaerophilus ATCC 43158 TaxID=1032070 RepID=A0AAD0TU20_9BACT|nr:endonuclease/exonuclease/phosphatase family protein [Aliarcobacter cryaerophilus]AYJ80463.1 endonuclease/exonuclease/phosphatase [Aliarcobacter cryaerophilus ATCC 43158]PRM95149.1 endonuclease [Aliarcobacter cryaerophilus]QCZ24678.1 endonuclease [Aliarcobacter cryaerophilus ATCC 43158]